MMQSLERETKILDGKRSIELAMLGGSQTSWPASRWNVERL